MANLVEQAKRQIDERPGREPRARGGEGAAASGAALAGTVEVPKDVNNGDLPRTTPWPARAPCTWPRGRLPRHL